MKTLYMTILIVFTSMALAFTVGCESDAQTAAAIGSLAGAGIGQLAGHDTEATLIGAAVGGGVGYFLGNESDKQKSQAEMSSIRNEMNYTTVNVTNSNGSIVQVRLQKYGVGYVGTRGEYYAKLPTEDQLRPVYGF
jgi:hypothetical protein